MGDDDELASVCGGGLVGWWASLASKASGLFEGSKKECLNGIFGKILSIGKKEVISRGRRGSSCLLSFFIRGERAFRKKSGAGFSFLLVHCRDESKIF